MRVGWGGDGLGGGKEGWRGGVGRCRERGKREPRDFKGSQCPCLDPWALLARPP